jgi:hypothetical protein
VKIARSALTGLGAVVLGTAILATPLIAQDKGGPDDPNRASQRGDGGAFGYIVQDGASGCGYDYIDITGTGTPLTFTASGTFPAEDDGGAAVTLAQPVNFYGTPVSDIVVSSNGYIAMGTTNGLADEDGGDFSEDCPLPAVPGNAVATNARVMPFHNDLAGDGSGGAAFTEFFASCPRASETGGDEPCTIVSYDSWGLFGDPATYDMQVIMYHTSGLMVYQYDDPDGALDPTSAAIGLQNAAADDAAVYACAVSVPVDGNSVCSFDPAFGPGSLAIPEFESIPTMSRTGLILLMLALGLVAGVVLIRRG